MQGGWEGLRFEGKVRQVVNDIETRNKRNSTFIKCKHFDRANYKGVDISENTLCLLHNNGIKLYNKFKS
jgi:hypothetical protein